MLTGHECIRALAEIRTATPRVRYRWPYTPDSVWIETTTLFISMVDTQNGSWFGWASDRREPEGCSNSAWPTAHDGRFFDELDAVLKRVKADGRLNRHRFDDMPF